MKDLEKLSYTMAHAAGSAVNAADKVLLKGKAVIETAALMRRHEKAQLQLGALVYSLHKRGEENTLLVNRYIEAIESIEAKIKQQSGKDIGCSKNLQCPHCGQIAMKNAVFCRACGERL